ncbi:MAG: tetratricopeptide repeat protein [Thermoleophilia bacterium]
MRKFGAAVIIVMGLYAIVQAVSRISIRTLIDAQDLGISYVIYFLAPSAALIIFGASLIFFRERLASRWFPDSAMHLAIQGVHVVRLGLIFAGLLFTVAAASAIIVTVMAAIQNQLMMDEIGTFASQGVASFWTRLLPPLIGDFVQLGMGAALIIGSTRIARRVWAMPSFESASESAPACSVCGRPYDPADYGQDAKATCFSCHEPLDLGADAWNEMGLSLDEAGRHLEAQSYFDRAIELNPEDGDLWNNKGVGLDSLGRHEEAIVSYNKGIQLKPGDADIWYNKAESQQSSGFLKEALASYQKALDLDPFHSDALYNKAELEKQLHEGGQGNGNIS